MATNPQAPGQTKISFQISEEEKAELQKLADASGMKLSAYIRKVLLDAMAERTVYSVQRHPSGLALMAAEDPALYGAKKPRPPKPGNDQAG